MKIIGVGDILIPENYIEEGFKSWRDDGHELITVPWNIDTIVELQNINLQVETQGCNSYTVSDEMIEKVKDAEMMIVQFFTVNKQVIDACPNLKYVGVLRGGIENVDADYAASKGIAVFNTPGRNSNAVADFAVGMMLAESRNIAKSHLELKNGKWVRYYSNKGIVPELPGRTVGIIGLGAIGQKVARRVHGFDANVIFFDPYVNDYPDFCTKVDDVKEIFKQSDFVTIHGRLTEENERMVNAEMLSLMKPTAYLINTARSGFVDEKDLYDALKEKKIAGAAIDVFDEEPIDNTYPLATLDNITITPHLAGGTDDAFINSPKSLSIYMKEDLNNIKNSRYVLNRDKL